MNQVYISGFIVGNPVLKMEKENIPHLLFSVDIQHKTRSGKLHHEQYQVNAWHNVALKGAESLKNGQAVMVRGYLTQRMLRSGDMTFMLTEVTAEEFLSANSYRRKVVSEKKDNFVKGEEPSVIEDAVEDPT